jgi:hypothetical protein
MTDINPIIVAKILLLVTVANSAPVVAKKILGKKLSYPVDQGLMLCDDRELFGRSKTIRGIVVSILATALCASLIGLTFFEGAYVAAGSMAGDLLSSFLKRRMKIPPSGMALGLDQLPEAVLPVLALKWCLGWPITFAEVSIVGVAFFIGELAASRLFFALKIRDQPY